MPKLAWHCLALLLLLLTVWWAVGVDGVFFPDEGAVLLQAVQLSEDGTWVVSYELLEEDPDLSNVPIAAAGPGVGGYIPYEKHPLVPAVASPAVGAFGSSGALLPGIVALVAAAAVAAALTERLRAGSAVPAFWLTAIGTPLLVQSGIATWHTVAAAAVIGIVGIAITVIERGPLLVGPRRAGFAAGVAALAGLAVLVRAEAAIAAGAVLGAALLSSRAHRWRLVSIVGVPACVGTALAVLAEGWWRDRLVVAGSGGGIGLGGGTQSSPRGIWPGFQRTMLDPALAGTSAVDLLVVVGTALAIAAAYLLRRRSLDGASAFAVGAAALLVARAVLGTSVVPSVLYSEPVVIAGLVGLRRRDVDARIMLIGTVALLTMAGVVATQYADGGGLQFGGRLFALIVPCLAVLGAAGAASLAPAAPRAVRAATVVAVLATAVIGVRAVVDIRSTTAEAVEAVVAVRESGADTAVVMLDASFGRRAWEHVQDGIWLSVSPTAPAEEVGPVLDGLRDRGIEDLVVVMVGEVDLGPLEGEVQVVGDPLVLSGPARPDWVVVRAELTG